MAICDDDAKKRRTVKDRRSTGEGREEERQWTREVNGHLRSIIQRRTFLARAMTEFCCPGRWIGFSLDFPEVGKPKITGKLHEIYGRMEMYGEKALIASVGLSPA